MITQAEKTSTEAKAVAPRERPPMLPILRRLVEFYERTPEAEECVSSISISRLHDKSGLHERTSLATVYIGGLDALRRMFPGCRAVVARHEQYDTYTLCDTSFEFVAVENKAKGSMFAKEEEVTL